MRKQVELLEHHANFLAHRVHIFAPSREVNAVDPDGQTVVYSGTAPGGFSFDPSIGRIATTQPAIAGDYYFTATATDPDGLTDTALVHIKITAGNNKPPEFLMTGETDPSVQTVDTFEFNLIEGASGIIGQINADDPENDSYKIASSDIPSPFAIDANGQLSVQANETASPGTYTFNIEVTGTKGNPGPDTAVVTINVTEVIVDLQIYNGQGATSPVVEETSLGAFTVANLNDTDGDGTPDNVDQYVTCEQDLMRLVIKKPVDQIVGNVILTVSSGVALWRTEDKFNPIPLINGSVANFTAADFTSGDLTVWVELTAASTSVRDVSISLSYAGKLDTVKATGIWTAYGPQFLTTGAASTAVSGIGTQLTVAPGSVTPFQTDRWIHVFHDGDWSRYVITGVSGNNLTLDRALTTLISAGDIVRQGYWKEVDNVEMLDSFEERALVGGGLKQDGAYLGMEANYCNSVAMRFQMTPTGIGDVIKNHTESGIQVDITRQAYGFEWRYQTPTSGPDDPNSWILPSGDIANDDSRNRDEDTDFYSHSGITSDYVYSRDMPGDLRSAKNGFRYVQQLNMLEFVRIKLNGDPFRNMQNESEGSRSSYKLEWRSRIDLIDGNGDGIWERNLSGPFAGNSLELGHLFIGTAP